jgi:hypothetical protein
MPDLPKTSSKELPSSAFSEPSEPSEMKPSDKPKEQVRKSRSWLQQVVLISLA